MSGQQEAIANGLRLDGSSLSSAISALAPGNARSGIAINGGHARAGQGLETRRGRDSAPLRSYGQPRGWGASPHRSTAERPEPGHRCCRLGTRTQPRPALRLLEPGLADGKRAPDALTAAVEYAKQQERQRLAGLLHDDLQQLLVAAQLGVIEAQRRLGTEGRETDHAIGEALDRVANLLRQSLSATRDLTADLARSRPQDGGLIEALGWLVQLMAERYGLRVTLTADSTAATLDAEVHQVVFDGVREALFNTVKHAGCAEAEIAVCVVGEQLRVVVSDQGNGADPARRLGVVGGGTGLGLRRTRERLHAIGGSLDVERPPGAGTRVTLHAPLTKTTAPSHLAHDDAELGQSTLRAFA